MGHKDRTKTQQMGDILYDFGVYHLTALVYPLNRVKEVCGIVKNNKTGRFVPVQY